MKSFSLLAITAVTLSGAAWAQTQSYSSSQTQSTQTTQQTQGTSSDAQAQGQSQAPMSSTTTGVTTPSASTSATPSTGATPSAGTTSSTTTTTSSTTSAPAPQVSEQKVDLTTEPGPPADLRAARTEAVNALAWAKREGCRSDPSPRDCVQRAQDDYRATMARLGGSAGNGGTVSASGTSQAGGSNARADRN